MKNSGTVLPLLLALILSGATAPLRAYAQADSGPRIWMENDGGLGRDYLTNGKTKVSQGFFGSFDLSRLVQDNPEALAHVERQSKFTTYSHLAFWLGSLPSAFIVGYGLGSTNSTMTWAGLGALVATNLLLGYFISESRHSMFEAINTYNGVKRERVEKISRAPAPDDSTAVSPEISPKVSQRVSWSPAVMMADGNYALGMSLRF